MEFVTITSGDLSCRINPLGAELWSLKDSAGREYMTDADPAFWTGHAPILFPVVGALNGGVYHLDGREYALGKHGFARHSMFQVKQSDENEAFFSLRDNAETLANYPFAFALDITFRLQGHALHVEAQVRNPGARDMPFSFGFHPAFAWPLPGGAAKTDHCVSFERDEPQPIRRIEPASGLLLAQAQPTPVDGHTLHPDASMFVADALIWDHLASRSATFGAPRGTQIAVGFPDTSMLGIWQKPGANYLCIEPWQGIADPVGFTGDLRDKPGIVSLPPGDTRRFRMDITILSAD